MFLNQKLVKPLTFFDFETTDKEVKTAKVVEFAFIKVMPDGSEFRLQGYVNPGTLIPEEATAIHGISNDAVADMPMFNHYSYDIYTFIKDSDLAGYNSNRYDIPILVKELADCGFVLDVADINVVDVRNIYVRKEPRTLSAAYQFYKNRELDDAHSAMIDVVATKAILEEQIWRYREDFPETIEDLAIYTNFDVRMYDPTGTFIRNADGVVLFNFGKHRDKPILSERSYLIWMLNEDFPMTVKQIINNHLTTN